MSAFDVRLWLLSHLVTSNGLSNNIHWPLITSNDLSYKWCSTGFRHPRRYNVKGGGVRRLQEVCDSRWCRKCLLLDGDRKSRSELLVRSNENWSINPQFFQNFVIFLRLLKLYTLLFTKNYWNISVHCAP